MITCACAQCAEHPGQFKNYAQCESCELYGHESDDFPDGGTVCYECLEERERSKADRIHDEIKEGLR